MLLPYVEVFTSDLWGNEYKAFAYVPMALFTLLLKQLTTNTIAEMRATIKELKEGQQQHATAIAGNTSAINNHATAIAGNTTAIARLNEDNYYVRMGNNWAFDNRDSE